MPFIFTFFEMCTIKIQKNLYKIRWDHLEIDWNIINGDLEFEGEYLNGKLKEYNDDGELEFEGEYLLGGRNGKGKHFNSFGKLDYEGEYLNGERNEKEKGNNFLGKLDYEGEYIYGKRWNEKEKIIIRMVN